MRAFNDLRRLALNASVLFLALLPMGVRGQQTPQAIPLSSGACKLDGTVGCGGGGGGGTGLLTLNGLTADPQSFARVNDTNVTLTISSATATHTFTLGWTGSLAETRGGTGQSTFTLGDTLYASAANTLSKLAGNTTSTKNFLCQTGNGTVSAAPAWCTIVSGDVPTLNQNTTGSAATLATPRSIYGNNFDGSAALTQVIASTYGGTGNGFTKFSGPATSEKTFTLPDASSTILTDNAAVTVAQGGTGGATATAYGVVLTGTTGTGGFKLDLGPGTSTYVLTSNGAGAYPTWQAPASDFSITADSAHGAVALQGSSPGTQQTGNSNISGTATVGGNVSVTGNVNVSGNVTGQTSSFYTWGGPISAPLLTVTAQTGTGAMVAGTYKYQAIALDEQQYRSAATSVKTCVLVATGRCQIFVSRQGAWGYYLYSDQGSGTVNKESTSTLVSNFYNTAVTTYDDGSTLSWHNGTPPSADEGTHWWRVDNDGLIIGKQIEIFDVQHRGGDYKFYENNVTGTQFGGTTLYMKAAGGTIAADGTITSKGGFVSSTSSSPASGAACTAGTIAWDASYIYVCTASGAWKRAALTGGY